ncbi:RNA-binding protein YlmH, contains S4-like domain [Thalassobacillus cyri]|uniref:RNA-binding protein YlmH, contains S4-like domain n=1 Tax=Thalassobacillus cyri TaxID=571932 RepID=A0A1H4H6T8_9BACI|nr:RNA-binding protein [Thalassobacillus cyri]SEB17465.1 RNA-binding protein YlmH, contains S4-like domain [Thalassobacillus cyri]
MDIYQHFRKEEQPFIDQVLSWQEEVGRSFQSKLTDFLDPREQFIFESLLGNHPDFTWKLFGGREDSERKRGLLAPYYEQIQPDQFDLTLLEASYPEKFVTLTHPDVLGAFMSLGIKRKKLGDLIVRNGVVQIIVASEIADYVRMNLDGIKKATVHFQEISFDRLLEDYEQWEELNTTVSSLRLDTLIKEIYRISRQKASLFIEKGQVKVNFRIVEDTSFKLQSGDIISIRGKGRSKLTEVLGTTKKDKYKVIISRLK